MKRILMFMFVLVLIVGTVSAFELNPFADKKIFEREITLDMDEFIKTDFNDKYGVIRLSKTFFWFESDKIAEYSLIDNTEQCTINCEAKGKAILYSDEKLFDGIQFIGRGGIEKQLSDVQYWLKGFESIEVNDYKIECLESINKTGIYCDRVLDGSHLENKTIWNKYNFEVLQPGNYEWKLTGTKEYSDNVDFQITINNQIFTEWAFWNGTGGTITIDGNFTIHTFTSDGTFGWIGDTRNVTYLVIGGGGSGAKAIGGGGGAGGYLTAENFSVSAGNFTITIGQGGISQTTGSTNGLNGGNTSFGNVTAQGGGGGGAVSNSGNDGGSGGGEGQDGGGGLGVAGQGFDGGGSGSGGGLHASGGGGASEVGEDSAANAGAGGDGLSSTINGTNVTRAGGGGGSTNGGTRGAGGAGGGGQGGDFPGDPSGQAGTVNTGSGGGGAEGAGNSGAGGSGIVIIRFLTFTEQAPTITLNSPIEAFNSSIQTINFNGTVTAGTGITNVTLFIDGILNETNSSAINDTDYLFTKVILEGNHNWTYESCNTIGCTTATTRTFTIDTAPIINVFSPTNSSFTTSTIFFNATTSLSVDAFIVNYNGTNVTLVAINTTLEVEDGVNFNLLFYANNSATGVFGLNDTIFFSVDTTAPQITLSSPIGDQGTFAVGRNLTLNWNITEANPDTCQFEYKGINTTITCSANTTNFTVTDSVNTSLIFYVNDTFGQTGFAIANWSYSFIENLVTFTENVSETASEFFQINLSTSLSVLSITAQLNYDGTNFISKAACDVDCIVNNTIDIPLVTNGNESALKDFFWVIDIFNGTDSISVTTSTREQNSSRIHIESCGGAFTTQALNFTASDERNLSRVDPYDFDGTFDIWLGGGSVKRNNNFTNAGITEKTFCILPNKTFFTDAQIDYDAAGNVTLYTPRNYFLQNNTISNVSQDISLFLLDVEFSTSFILKVQDDNLLPLEGHLIKTERFYPGENIFRVVQIAKTNEAGKSVGFFETETVDYRFLISLNDLTLLTTTQGKIVGELTPFTLTFTIGENLGKPWKDLENLTDLEFTLFFNTSNNIVTYTYIDTSGNFTLGTLIIELTNQSFSTNPTLCSVNSTQSSATLTCNMSGNTTGLFSARAFIERDDGETLISQVTFLIQSLLNIIGLTGVFLAFFLILISAFAFKFNEIAGIFMVNATVIFVNIIGLVSFGMLAISALLAVSIIIVVVMQK